MGLSVLFRGGKVYKINATIGDNLELIKLIYIVFRKLKNNDNNYLKFLIKYYKI